MKYRRLGKTKISVSEIGFGTWGIGGATTDGAHSYGVTDDAESLRALNCALDKGITFYDTAGIYGYGHAEELLGEAFSGKRDKIVIATKAGSVNHDGEFNVAPSYIRTCLEESLRRLKTDYVDVYQFHSVSLELVRKVPECLETMQDLKREGKIRAFGYSVKSPIEALAAIKEFGAEVIQLTFNMLDLRAIHDGAFDAARTHGVGVIARVPFCFGFLTGTVTSTQFAPNDHRSAWPKEQLLRWMEAPKMFSAIDPEKLYTKAQLALKFCIASPEVSTVIPGMLTVREVEENTAASSSPSLSEEKIKAIERISGEHKFYIQGK